MIYDPTRDELFAAEKGSGTYRSTDLGSTWTPRNTTSNYFKTSSGGSQGSYDDALWVSPIDSNFLLVGGIDLYRSADGGLTLVKISDWTKYHTGLSAHADQHAIVADSGFNGKNLLDGLNNLLQDIDRGDVIFEGNRYLLTHGTINFANPTRIEGRSPPRCASTH